MQRPRVTVFLGVSLDGFIAGKGHDLSWLEEWSTDSPDETGYTQLMQETNAMVMGRNTWEKVRGFEPWPYAGKRVVVLTHRPFAPEHGEESHTGALVELLESLYRQGCGSVYLDGGGAVREGLKARVVDCLILNWVPVVLGEGIPLFGRDLPFSKWRPVRVRRFPSGLVQVSMVPAG